MTKADPCPWCGLTTHYSTNAVGCPVYSESVKNRAGLLIRQDLEDTLIQTWLQPGPRFTYGTSDLKLRRLARRQRIGYRVRSTWMGLRYRVAHLIYPFREDDCL